MKILPEARKKKLDYSKQDVNNDGKVDKTDSFLKHRNKVIADAQGKKSTKKEDKKKKVGKMKVTCNDCDSPIEKVVESREEFRIKLRGYCENCKRPKVAYLNDVKTIVESGKRFDFIVKENLPTTATPAPSAAKPSTTTPTSTTTPSASAATPKPTTPTPATTPFTSDLNNLIAKHKITAQDLVKALSLSGVK